MRVSGAKPAFIAAVFFAGSLAAFLATAGPLNPPAGPVTSSYKTLTEVEPRTAINSTNTPGGAGETFLITQPGSYYLTGNITMSAGKTAIGVNASDVTIDMNGYTIIGQASGGLGIAGYGGAGRIVVRGGSFRAGPLLAISIGAESLVENVQVSQSTTGVDAISVGDRSVVRNCRVSTAGAAVLAGNQCFVTELTTQNVVTGVYALGKTDVVVEDCSLVATTSGTGVYGGLRATLRRCELQGFTIGVAAGDYTLLDGVRITNSTVGINGGKFTSLRNVSVLTTTSGGIQVGDFSALDRVEVRNSADTAINMGNDCTLTQCTVSGVVAAGVIAGSRNTFVDCTSSKNTGGTGFLVADGNTFQNCRADENAGDGFNGRFGNVWRSCSARSNSGDGIEGSSGTCVLEGRFDSNGNGASVGANIRLTGDAARIEGNTLIGGDFGIQTTSGGNLIIRNSSRNSSNSYGGIAAGNDVGPIGSGATATSPWANIQY